jgi:hypothetical protein
MIRIHFTAEDLALTRFLPEPAPLMELKLALVALHRRDAATRFSRWRRAALTSRGLTNEQRQWAEESGFARMQTALATIVSATFDGRVFDKAHCLRVFEQHYERVRRTVPAERLLVYRVQEGWEPLCRFLGADVPGGPFPRVNVGDDLLRNIRTAMRLARAQTGEALWR